MALTAMASLAISFRKTEAVGLATQTTDCDWLAESTAEDGTHALSAQVLIEAQPRVVELPGAVLSVGAKNVGTGEAIIDVAGLFTATLPPQGGIAISCPTGSSAKTLTISGAGADVKLVAVLRAG